MDQKNLLANNIQISFISHQDNEAVANLVKESFRHTEDQFKHLMIHQVIENPVIWILFAISVFCLTPFCGSIFWGILCGFGAMCLLLCISLGCLYYKFSLLKEENIEDSDYEGSYAGYYSKRQYHMIVVKYMDDVVGCCALVPTKDPTSGELIRMSVTKSCQRLGLGYLLERKITELAREENYKKIILTTSAFLKSANNFYQKNGYAIVKVDILVAIFPWHWDLIHYVKQLD